MSRIMLSILSFVCFLAGCGVDGPEDVVATARCGDAETVQTRLGIVNLPQLPLGRIFWARHDLGTAGPIDVLPFDFADTVVAEEFDSVKVAYEAALEVAFSGSIPGALRSDLESVIRSASQLTATNVQRTSLKNAVALVNETPAARTSLSQHLAYSPNSTIYLIHSASTADELRIGLAGGRQVNATTSVVSVGDFDLQVNYRCDNLLVLTGNRTGTFFKVLALGYDSETDQFFNDTGAPLDLSRIRMDVGR